VVVVVPIEFETETSSDVGLKDSVGVPLITQVELFIVRPNGKLGNMVQELIEEPLFKRDVGVIDILLPKDPFVPAAPKKVIVGAIALTVRLTFASVEVPALLVALMV